MLTLISLTMLIILLFSLLCYALCRPVSDDAALIDQALSLKRFYSEQVDELARVAEVVDVSANDLRVREELQQRLFLELSAPHSADSVSEQQRSLPMLFVICVLALSLPLFALSVQYSGLVEWWQTRDAQKDIVDRLLQQPSMNAAMAVQSPATLFALQERLQINPAQPSRWFALGLAWQGVGHLEFARLAMEQAWRQEPENLQYVLAYAQSRFLWEQGHPEAETMRLLDEVLTKAPQEPHALVLAGMGAFRLGEDVKAVGLLRRFLSLSEASALRRDPGVVQEIKAVLSTIQERQARRSAQSSTPSNSQ
jgi:cytochrome c-type biogenesis protein CcmH/NrfG